MGSCFAREIKDVLVARGYHYVAEETHHPAARHASAAWERLYNPFSMRQVFEYTFGEWRPALRWWVAPRSGTVQDPYRRVVLYPGREEAEADFARHREHSRRALTRARVLILTLGLTEIWEDQEDGAVICLPAGPYPNEGGAMDRYRFRVSRYQESLDQLERIHALLAAHNPPAGWWGPSPRPPLGHLPAGRRRGERQLQRQGHPAGGGRRVRRPPFQRQLLPGLRDRHHPLPAPGRPAYADSRENFHVNRATVELIMANFFARYGREP